MFSNCPHASKVALVKLVDLLREGGFTLLDTQWVTPHLARFGAKEIPREEYIERLESSIVLDAEFPEQPGIARPPTT
jgi:leucyl/phenylalanyl-tRNA--protein transferase